jgi:hypothetical protein
LVGEGRSQIGIEMGKFLLETEIAFLQTFDGNGRALESRFSGIKSNFLLAVLGSTFHKTSPSVIRKVGTGWGQMSIFDPYNENKGFSLNAVTP